MKSRSTICLFLSLIILAAHAHCVATHADELVVKIEASQDGVPLRDNSPPCESSGCICGGALVGKIARVVIEQDDSIQWFLLTNFVRTINSAIVVEAPESSRPFSEPVTHYGGALARAILQSFQV